MNRLLLFLLKRPPTDVLQTSNFFHLAVFLIKVDQEKDCFHFCFRAVEAHLATTPASVKKLVLFYRKGCKGPIGVGLWWM